MRQAITSSSQIVRAHGIPSDRRRFVVTAMAAAFLLALAGIGSAMDHAAAANARSAIASIARATAASGVEADMLQFAIQSGDGERERVITNIVMGNLFDRLGGQPSLNVLVRGTSVGTRIADGSVTTDVCVRAEARTMIMTIFGLPTVETESCARAVGFLPT